MKPEIKNAYTKLINKHFSAVQADTELGLCDNASRFFSLKKKSKKFWEDFEQAEKEFLTMLE